MSIDTSDFAEVLREKMYNHREMIDWAHSYNAYERLGSDLGMILRPLQQELMTSGRIPEWAGVDLLRGLAFFRVRAAAHHEAPDYALDDEQFMAAVDRLLRHPAAGPSDRPPL